MTAWHNPLLLYLLRHAAVQPDTLENRKVVGLLRMRHWTCALLSLKELPLARLSSDTVVRNAVLKSCVQDRIWEQASVMLSQFCIAGLQVDAIAVTTLASGQADAEWKSATSLFQTFRKHHLEIDAAAGCVAASSVGKRAANPRWQQALSAVGTMLLYAVQCNVRVHNAAAAALDRAGQWARSLSFTSQLAGIQVSPDALTFSSAVRAHSQGTWRQTLVALFALLWQGADTKCFPPALDACASARAWEKSLMLFTGARRMLLRVDAATRRAAMLSSTDDWHQVLDMLQLVAMRGDGECPATFAAALSVLDERGAWARSLNLFFCSAEMSLKPSLEACSLALRACSRARKWQHALQLIGEAEEGRVQVDGIAFNTLMNSFDAEQWQKVLGIFTCHDLQFNAVSHRSAMKTSGKSGKWQLCLEMFQHLEDLRLGKEDGMDDASCDASCVAAVDAFSCKLRWSEAIVLTTEQLNKRATFDVSVNNAVATCCSRASQWHHALRRFWASGAVFTPDVISYGAAISACETSGLWQSALDLQSLVVTEGLQASIVVHGAAMSSIVVEGKWQLASSSLASLQTQKTANIIACNSVMSACEAGSYWQRSLEFLSGASVTRLRADVVSFNLVINSCGKSDAWQMALLVLHVMSSYCEPDLMSVDSVLTACLKCSVQPAPQMLREFAHLRPPLSLLWSLAASCVSDPEIIERACIDAADHSKWTGAADAALFVYSVAFLGAQSRRLHQAVQRAMEEMSSLSLDTLLMCCLGAVDCPKAAALAAAAVPHLQDVLAAVGCTARLHSYDFPKSGSKLLGVVFSCRLTGCLPARLYSMVHLLLLEVGRDLDGPLNGWPPPSQRSFRFGSWLPKESEPQVLQDLDDRAAIFKPSGWEVYGGHSRLQLVTFIQSRFGNRRIFEDAQHHFGFLHRLDVPSSGLIVCSKTFEAFYDLQLQLHAGHLCRDYQALSHGWLPPRPEFAPRIFWHGDGPSVSGGRGRPSCTLLLFCRHCLHSLGPLSLLSLRLRTGRKHQIRSHLAHVGSPVVGDEVYQAAPTHCADSTFCQVNWLHRCRLSFQDLSGRRQEVHCRLPSDLDVLLSQVRNVRAWTCAGGTRAD